MSRLKLGIVGAGVAGLRHLTRLAVRDDVTLTAVVDPAPAQRAEVTRIVNVQTFESADAMLAAERVDAAVICTPPDQRGPTEELFLEHRIPILIEKPIASDVATAEQLARRVKASGVPVAVGYQWRQLSFLPRVRRLLEGRDVSLVVATWMCPPSSTPWWGDTRSAGGQIVEQATHLVDLAIALNGDLEVVAGFGSAARMRGSTTGFHKASTILVRFANGAAGSVVTTCILAEPYRRSLELLADDFTLVIREDGGACITSTIQESWSHQGPDLYVREHDAFLELARSGNTDKEIASYSSALTTHRAATEMEAAMLATRHRSETQ